MNVWTAYGFAAMRRMDELMRSEMGRTGHQEVSFPLLIPESEFQKEAQHIKGFSDEVYWVTHAGANPLDVRLCLRPTSEAAMYPIFALWIRSPADLQVRQDIEVMDHLARWFCVPYLLNRRPEWDKFPGAFYSLACDSVMPTGRTLQVGTIHHYKDNFARAYAG